MNLADLTTSTELHLLNTKQLQAIAKEAHVKGWHSARKAQLIDSITEVLMAAEAQAARDAEVEAAATAVEAAQDSKPVLHSRKECIAILNTTGYTGPTSYLMPKLRAIVDAEVARYRAEAPTERELNEAFGV